MNKLLLLVPLMAFGAAGTASALVPVDFEKITHWTGSGPNRAALVISNDAGASDPMCYVWGYRWENGATPTGEDMFKAICANSDELVLLTQLTGVYGSTVCGIGFGNARELLQNIHFDFEMAKDYEFINFDYYNASALYGQKDAPGDNTPVICQCAIDEAINSKSHVILHPLNYTAYGYPAYDYDCWKLEETIEDIGWWSSAWYTGYWSYWTASVGGDEYMYSGTGFSGRILFDGAVDAWSFTMFDTPGVGGFGEGQAPSENAELYSYRSVRTPTHVEEVPASEACEAVYYRLDGTVVSANALTAGIYIVRSGSAVKKVYIH